jgi:hypothetical protein
LGDDLSVNVAALAATEADARAMEQGARQALAKGRTMIQELLKDPTQPSGYKLVVEIIDTVSLSVDGTTVRGSATLGTGLGMIGLLSAVAIPAFLRYTVEAREEAVQARVAADQEAQIQAAQTESGDLPTALAECLSELDRLRNPPASSPAPQPGPLDF